MSEERKIDEYLLKAKREYRIMRAVKGLMWGIITWIILFNLYLISSLIIKFKIGVVSLVISLALFTFIGFLIGLFWSIVEKETVSKIDKKMNFKDSLITLYEYQKKGKTGNPFYRYLLKQTIELIRYQKSKKVFKIKWFPELNFVGISILITLFIIVGFGTETNNSGEILFNNSVSKSVQKEGEGFQPNEEKLELLEPLKLPEEEKQEGSSVSPKGDNSGERRDDLDYPEDQEQTPTSGENDSSLEDKMNLEDKEEVTKEGQQNNGSKQEESNFEDYNSPRSKSGDLEPGDQQKSSGTDKDNSKVIASGDNRNSEEGDEGLTTQNDNDDNSEDSQQNQGLQGEKKSNQDQKNGEEELEVPGSNKGTEGENEKTGFGAGTEEGGLNENEFHRPNLNDMISSKLQSRLGEQSYLNSYLEELYPPENEGDVVLNNYLKHHQFLLNKIEQKGFPSIYHKIVKDYFIIINE